MWSASSGHGRLLRLLSATQMHTPRMAPRMAPLAMWSGHLRGQAPHPWLPQQSRSFPLCKQRPRGQAPHPWLPQQSRSFPLCRQRLRDSGGLYPRGSVQWHRARAARRRAKRPLFKT
eukprot:Amastigsp_a184812_6.p2 type:complete len:117 gc:universal Amastigsp_a184812_6:686-336(-)